MEYYKELHAKVIEAFQNNPKMLQSLIDLTVFQRTKHSIHDKNRPCNKNGGCGECEDYYSADTEYDNDYEIKIFFKSLCKILPIPIPIKEEESDEGDESSDE